MEIKSSQSVSHSYSPFPSLLLFIGFPSKRLSDLNCSDSREPRGPHALGTVQLSKNTKGTRLLTIVPFSTPFISSVGRAGFAFSEERNSHLCPQTLYHILIQQSLPTLSPRTFQSSHEVLEIEVPCSVALASICQILHDLSIE